MLLQELDVLFLESEFAVMFHLVADVFTNGISLGGAHGKRTESILPSKNQTRSILLIDIFARVRLQFSYEA